MSDEFKTMREYTLEKRQWRRTVVSGLVSVVILLVIWYVSPSAEIFVAIVAGLAYFQANEVRVKLINHIEAKHERQ